MRLWFLIDSEVKDGVSVGGRAAYQSYPEQQKINDYQIGGLSSVWKSASKKVNLEDLDCTAASSEWLFKWFIWHDWAFVSPFFDQTFLSSRVDLIRFNHKQLIHPSSATWNQSSNRSNPLPPQHPSTLHTLWALLHPHPPPPPTQEPHRVVSWARFCSHILITRNSYNRMFETLHRSWQHISSQGQ